MKNEKPKFDLEDRLAKFACKCLDVLPASKAGQNLEYQLSKSGTRQKRILANKK